MKARSAYYWPLAALIILSLAGCAPTYPKEKFKESIIRLCKNEYDVDIKVRTIGKTVAIYIPLDDLMDYTFALNPAATDKLNDVIMGVTRVVLSTDADYDFYCVIAHDNRIPEIQVIIIKCVNDVKRVFLGDISRGEFSKRMIVDMRLSPQSQKERSVGEIFQKMNLDPTWQEQVMNDFFRSEPTGLGDIGYWNGRFYIKDIGMSEFLAEQISSRIKMEFREDRELAEKFLLKSVKSAYYEGVRGPFFSVEFMAEPKVFEGIDTSELYKRVYESAMKVAADVINGYKFDSFDYVEAVNQANGIRIRVPKDDLKKFKRRGYKLDEQFDLNYGM